MNTLRNTRTATLIALTIAGLLAGCDRGETTPPPTPSTAPDNTMTAPPSPPTPPATTPPVAPEATTPPPGTPEPSTPAAPGDNAAPGATPDSGTSGTEPPPAAPGSGSSRIQSPDATLAAASPSALRDRYGVALTRVANKQADANKLGRADRNFVEDAAEKSLYEEAAAKVAVERARTPAVKAFAEMLASRHGAANAELKRLAGSWDVSVPTELTLMQRRAVDSLHKVKDEDFEREFIAKVGIDDHRDDIARFEKAARQAKEPAVRAWAERSLPTLREHLAAARDLATASGIDTSPVARKSPSGTAGGTGNSS